MKSFFFFLCPDTKSPHLRLMYQSVSRFIVLLILVLVFHLGTPVPPCRHRRIRIHPTLTTTNPFIIFILYMSSAMLLPRTDLVRTSDARLSCLKHFTTHCNFFLKFNHKLGNLLLTLEPRTIKQSPKGWKVGRGGSNINFLPLHLSLT